MRARHSGTDVEHRQSAYHTSDEPRPTTSTLRRVTLADSRVMDATSCHTRHGHGAQRAAGMVVRQYVFFLRTSRPALSLKFRFAPNAHCKDPVKYICLRPSARRHLGPAVRFAISTILRSTARILNIRCTCDRIGYCSGRSPLYGSALPGTACQPALFTA